MAIPLPQVSWSLDGTAAARHGRIPLTLRGLCNWTDDRPPAARHSTHTPRALQLDGTCFASVQHIPSLLVGSGSLTVCARLRSSTPGALILSKLGEVGSAGGPSRVVGYGLEIGDERGVGRHRLVAHRAAPRASPRASPSARPRRSPCARLMQASAVGAALPLPPLSSSSVLIVLLDVLTGASVATATAVLAATVSVHVVRGRQVRAVRALDGGGGG